MKQIRLFLLCVTWLTAACNSENVAPQPQKTAADQPAPSPLKDSSAIGVSNGADSAVAPPDKILSPDKGMVSEEKESGSAAAPVPALPSVRAPAPPRPENAQSPDTLGGFLDIAALDPTIRLDIRYATANNFTNSKIYDCPRCLLRPEAAKALVKAHKALQKRGLGLKMYDCYRPRPYQQRLWDKVPDPDYVTPPAKGSMHSRGAAVDLTIVDKQGKELDMGTPYDFFGREAHTDNTKLPATVLANRRLLRETLEDVGFKGIRTEWWHFSYHKKKYPLSDYIWPCDGGR